MDKYTPAQCAEEDVALAVVSGLALPDDYPAYKSALKVAGGRCFKTLQPKLLKQLDDNNSYYRDHACALFQGQEGGARRVCAQGRSRAPAECTAARVDRRRGTLYELTSHPRGRLDYVCRHAQFALEPCAQRLCVRVASPLRLIGAEHFDRGAKPSWYGPDPSRACDRDRDHHVDALALGAPLQASTRLPAGPAVARVAVDVYALVRFPAVDGVRVLADDVTAIRRAACLAGRWVRGRAAIAAA